MVMDFNWTNFGGRFAIYTNSRSLHFTPEANVMLCQFYFI